MSETPQAEPFNLSSQIRNAIFQIGIALLLAARYSVGTLGWLPNFLSFLNIPHEFFRYASVVVGFMASCFC